jgi:hypothetical protein
VANGATLVSVDDAVMWEGNNRIVLDGNSNYTNVAGQEYDSLIVPPALEIVTGDGGGTLTGTGVASGVGSSVQNNGRIASTNAARVITLGGNVLNSGTIDAIGGDVLGAAGVNTFGAVPFALTNHGTLRAGVGGDFAFTGSVQQAADGTLEFALGGAGDEQFGQLVASNGIGLDGTLRALLANGFEPSVGESFPIILASGGTGLSGTFAATDFPTWQGGRTFAVSYSPQGASLVVVTPEPGAVGLIALLASPMLGRRRGRSWVHPARHR